ncbi:hypothetical protein E2C01_095856 [Portunus trituberculatus]|uniref:Uncharacterized protein n=1 Tax=Portunus trituberculatus TaxID=210409 RepID=A0A5B7K5D5_PORTR|nr:hypothetical protein [Portunus trituberculatus]
MIQADRATLSPPALRPGPRHRVNERSLRKKLTAREEVRTGARSWRASKKGIW